MKALLITDTDTSVRMIQDNIGQYGFDIIRYRSAIKAWDNLEEIAPDVVFISAVDFPRHWKTIVQYVRSDTGKDRTVIILLTNERFTPEDADKAVHIGVQAIVSEHLDSISDRQQLVEIFSRYRHVGQTEQRREYEPVSTHAVYMFSNPVTDTLITGVIEKLGLEEIWFRPDAPSATTDLAEGDTIGDCSLKVDAALLHPVCRIRKNTNLMVLDIISLTAEEKNALHSFIFGEVSV